MGMYSAVKPYHLGTGRFSLVARHGRVVHFPNWGSPPQADGYTLQEWVHPPRVGTFVQL